MKNFAHLHVHSCFSFQDGASSVEELSRSAASLGMGAMAITDHNNLCAAARFTKVAAECGIKPIHGAEITLEDGSHLVLLAESPKDIQILQGSYRSIYVKRVGNSARHRTFKRRGLQPKVSLASLKEHNAGIIALSDVCVAQFLC